MMPTATSRLPRILAWAMCLTLLLAVVLPARSDVLPWAPERMQSRLTAAQEAVQRQRYSDAVRLLDALLGEQAEDGFIPAPVQGGTQRTLRVEALALLASLPPEGLRQYEDWCGPKARRLLEAAIQGRDRAALAAVAHRYVCTAAGAEAALLLGYDGLDRGCPREALAWLRRLARVPAVARRFEPGLTLTTAVAWLTAGRPDAARAEVDRLRLLAPSVPFRIGDEQFTSAGDSAQILAVLEAAVAAQRAPELGSPRAWPLFRGGSHRNAQADWTGSLGPRRWFLETADSTQSDEIVRNVVAARYHSRSGAPLPAVHPLIVGPLVLTRNSRGLVAIGTESGKRLWEYPRDPPGNQQDDGTEGQQGRVQVLGHNPAMELAQRLHDDAPYGQISSDGRRVFLIDGLEPTWSGSMPVVILANGQRFIRPPAPKPYNRLVALTIEGQGRIAWSVGFESGEEEPKLAGAFFLGPPLPDGDHLYVLAEIGGEISLCCLNAAARGTLEWSLVLAVPPQPILSDPERRLAGATPSLTDGVLVCPTSAGAVVAVDPITRSILWGYQYPIRADRSRNVRLRMVAGLPVSGVGSDRSDSADASATLADGHVVLAPVESDELFCLDLFTGELVWKRTLDDLLYVACVVDQTVLVAGSEELSAWNLRSGKAAWEELAVELPDGARPSGRGLLAGGFYYLPTTAPAILKIDPADGRVVDRLSMKNPPGNLIALGPVLVSQSAEMIECFALSPQKGEPGTSDEADPTP